MRKLLDQLLQTFGIKPMEHDFKMLINETKHKLIEAERQRLYDDAIIAYHTACITLFEQHLGDCNVDTPEI